MKKRNLHLKLVFILFLMIVLGYFLYTTLISAHIDSASHKENVKFPFFEFTDTSGTLTNKTEIDIPIPSSTWNLTHLEVNFTDIFLEKELIPIEENPTDFYTLQKFQQLLAVQINITEQTIIYSVDIYADVIESTSSPVYIQINGFDIATEKPNNTIIYDPVELNVSNSPGWYRQTFTNPSMLKSGYYSLIINAAGIGNDPKPLYRWFNNIENATHPDLLIWTNNGFSWSDGIANQTFLHRFIQKTSQVLNPEDLNMQLELNGASYEISNGISQGTGNITIKNINFNSGDTNLYIPIITNRTVQVSFNCSYIARLANRAITSGFVVIEYNEYNLWNSSFIVHKEYLNYSIRFYYPSNWQNFSVFQNNINISPLISFNFAQEYIAISEDVLIDDATISIIANSVNYVFELDIRATDFNLDQELKFSIESPAPGNYTFILYDSLGYSLDDSIQTINYPTETNLFSYYIPASAKDGQYHAYVYFFDGYNAGIKVAIFNIRIPLIILLSIILIVSAIGISTIASSYVVMKKRKRKNEAMKKAIHDKFLDILNLNYIMISERKSSLNVYEQTFTAKTIDTTLISGFLSAIRSFGIELTNAEDSTQTIKLEYKDSKILMSEFKDFRIVLIMNDIPSSLFLESIRKLSYDIEGKYGKLLESFKGNVQQFKGIEELLKIHLNTSLLYPLKIVKTGKTNINQIEKNIINRAENVMKKRNSTYFYITYIVEQKSLDSKDIETLFSLLEKKVFQPVI